MGAVGWAVHAPEWAEVPRKEGVRLSAEPSGAGARVRARVRSNAEVAYDAWRTAPSGPCP
jgi:hypothetical protein